MKLNLLKTGVVGGAAVALLSTATFFSSISTAETSVYGRVGVEYVNESLKSDGSKETGGLSDINGSNRIGVKTSKDISGSMATKLSANVEVDFGNGGGAESNLRQANVALTLASGGVLTLGQQNNIRVGDGWYSNAFDTQASALERGVNGSRYAGVRYSHGFGLGSVDVMLGFDADDNGAEATSNTSKIANNLIDQMGFRVSLAPMPGVGVQVAYDSEKGNKSKNPEEKSDVSVAASYSAGDISAHVGYAMKSLSNVGNDKDAKNDSTSMSFNGKYSLGDDMAVFAGMSIMSYDYETVQGETDLEDQTAISVGLNMNALGGNSFVQFDTTSNKGGKDGEESTVVSTGYSIGF